jgi:hypothetical protein
MNISESGIVISGIKSKRSVAASQMLAGRSPGADPTILKPKRRAEIARLAPYNVFKENTRNGLMSHMGQTRT